MTPVHSEPQADLVTTLPQVAQGKTKIIYEENEGVILVRSKDDITAGDGARRDVLRGKAAIATATNGNVFTLLNAAGIATHYLGAVDSVTFRALRAQMIPLEVVTRRVATGSYLKRLPEVPEGTRFAPAILEFFVKDDARHDPQISEADIVAQGLLDATGLDLVRRETARVFEVIERAWGLQDVTLVDLKIEYGRLPDGQLVLADVIDNDSWRIWPGGDKAAMKDKQVYRNLSDRTAEALDQVLDNYRWVAMGTGTFVPMKRGLAVLVMGSPSDAETARSIMAILEGFGIDCRLRICSAHKDPLRLLEMVEQYEALARPVVFVAIAGRSNGLGPVLDGATTAPVINCPPASDRFGGMDILSSLRLPSGLACTTVLEPETAALAVVKTLALRDPALWSRMREHHRRLRYTVAQADRALSPPVA